MTRPRASTRRDDGPRGLRLEPIGPVHGSALARLVDVDDAVGIPRPRAPSDVSSWLAEMRRQERRGMAATFGVVELVCGLVGTIRIGGLASADDGNLSYWVAVPFRRRGFAVRAGELALHVAFSVLGRRSLFAFADERNVASRAVLRRLGFEMECLLRHRKHPDGPRTLELYRTTPHSAG